MDKEATLEAVEATLDAVEPAVEEIEKGASKLALLTRNHKIHVVLAAAVGGAIGSVVTYHVAKRKLQTKFDEVLKEEIEKEKAQLRRLHKKDEYADPVALAEKLHPDEVAEEPEKATPEDLANYQKKIAEVGYKVEAPKATEEELEGPDTEVVVSVFAKPNSDFDYEEAERNRSEDAPYILEHDEYMHCERDYPQSTLTYFAGDDVLVDENDKIIEDSDNVVGDANLQRFGYGSRDNNIVYIRNPKIEVEFEVVRSEGKYAQEVLGFIEHSDRPRHRGPRKFRMHEE